MQEKKIAIIGVLGGLGASLAEQFLKEDATLLGFDNGDPGASSPLHTSWQLDRLKKHPSFHFLPLDLRVIEQQDLRVDGEPVDIVINCAAVPPTRRAHTPQELIEEVHHDAVLRLVELATTDENCTILLPHYLPLQENDPRAAEENWLWLLDAEARVRQAIQDREHVQALPLPSLIGHGQSLRTMPIAQYLQALAQLPVALPKSDGLVTVASLQDCVNQILLLCDSDKTNKPYNILDTLAISNVSPTDLLYPLLEKAHLELISSSESASAWGAKLDERDIDASVDDLIKGIAEWLEVLPHVPPSDWPEVPARERRIMRSKRRRAKRNRTGGNE